MKKIQLFLLQGLLSSVPLYTLTAQTTTPSTHYAVETGIVAGHGDYSPFWFTANRQGLSSVKTENGWTIGEADLSSISGKVVLKACGSFLSTS